MDGNQVSNQTPATQFAQALMLEQINFIKNQLLESSNHQYLENIVHQIYQSSNQILLKDIIQLEQLNGVVQKYAFELNLGAEILEFIGFIAQKVHHFAVNSQTRFNDLLSDESFENWMYKILELDQLKNYIKDNLENNPQIHQVSLQLANQILEHNTPWLNQIRKYRVKDSGLSSRLLSFVQDQQQNLELKLEQQLAQAILKQLGYIITLPNSEMSEIVLNVWEDIKERTLQETFSQLQSIDVEEFFILVYETWKTLRKTSYIQDIVLHVVEGFYDYFAEYNLQALLESVGLNEHDLHLEAKRFAPYSLKALNDAGILENIIRAFIAPFYESDNAKKLIEEHLKNSE